MMGLEQATILTAHSCRCMGGGRTKPQNLPLATLLLLSKDLGARLPPDNQGGCPECL